MCRIDAEIFLFREVFNTCVDKFVEKLASSKANYTILSTLTRFAQFRCNSVVRLAVRESFRDFVDAIASVKINPTPSTQNATLTPSKTLCSFKPKSAVMWRRLHPVHSFPLFSTISAACPSES